MTTNPHRFINRELSWLEFNQRVLEEAQDERLPALERLRFVAISASNLDEFFMVRVGGLQILADGGTSTTDPAGLTPEEQLQAISRRVHQMVADQYACFNGHVEPTLAEAGLRRVRPEDLSERQRELLEQVFESEIYPIYTPQAVSTGAEFPLLPGLSLNICVQLAAKLTSAGSAVTDAMKEAGAATASEPRFAVLPLGRQGRRFFTVPSERGYAYILIEDLVRLFIARFFPQETILECVPFRITRNADLSFREDQAADLLVGMTELLTRRRQGDSVRLEIAANSSTATLEFLQSVLMLSERDLFLIPGPLELSTFSQLCDLKGFDSLRYESWPPLASPDIDPKIDIFQAITQQDILLHHPYESFDPVVRLIEAAADDPDVLAIKQILYRTSRNSPIVAALARAARRGKQVTAIVELKARFDEARNIAWAKNLAQDDVQVIYGVKGLKTHAKLCIVVRREPHGIQRYVHFGTGNYNEITSRIYSDISLMTCNEELGADASSFFNAITGYTQPQNLPKLAAAPLGLRSRLMELILGETERKRQGQKAQITAKLNSLVDPEIIAALYQASQAGVKVRLNVRGICCLRPGVPGLSENISVVSIVDRFLEHARILYFYHGGDERVFISSADWMPRNLDRRVELLVPIEAPLAKQRLVTILDYYFQDNEKARQLLPDGNYQRVKSSKRKSFRSQERLYQDLAQVAAQAEQTRRVVFEPHRAPNHEEL
jgi:polyphosphate kinase